jgi:hypothetical protein
MKKPDYTINIVANTTPEEAFNSINNVSEWWTQSLEGNSKKLDDEFTVRFGDVHYSKQKLVEVVPGKRVVWLITDSKLNFLENKQEWTNTRIIFDISTQNGKSKIQFTHVGLIPELECFDACSNAWSQYIQSLRSLVTTGKGRPAQKENAAK